MVTSAPAGCTHVWDIEPANGHTSPGTCRKCGETREFLNSCDALLEEADRGKPLEFRAARETKGEEMAKPDKHKRHKEIQKRWPEIKASIERLGSLNKAALEMGYSYDAVRRACKAHGFDMAPYCPLPGRNYAPVRETDARAFREKPPANGHDDIGDLLIGAGLVVIGGWLKKREQGG